MTNRLRKNAKLSKNEAKKCVYMRPAAYIYPKKVRCYWLYKISYIELLLGLIVYILYALFQKVGNNKEG